MNECYSATGHNSSRQQQFTLHPYDRATLTTGKIVVNVIFRRISTRKAEWASVRDYLYVSMFFSLITEGFKGMSDRKLASEEKRCYRFKVNAPTKRGLDLDPCESAGARRENAKGVANQRHIALHSSKFTR